MSQRGKSKLFKTKSFARFSRQERISDADLIDAIRRAQKGLVDADLGGHLIKQRVARAGQGSRGGFRVIVAYEPVNRTVFLLGFAKNDKGNITPKELESLKRIAALWLGAGDAAIEKSLKDGSLLEVKSG